VSDAGRAASGAVAGAARRVKGSIGDGLAYARDNFGGLQDLLPENETFSRIQSSLADTLDRQPLALAAIGLLVGAAVGGCVPLLGFRGCLGRRISDDVKADLSKRAGAVSQCLNEASGALAGELGDTAAEAINRLKQVAVDSSQATRR
jgi:hypothetical protein